jgi:hypothetical protein
METHADKVARAHSRLLALRKNIPDERHYVGEHYVQEYHEALRHLGEDGFDVEEFKVPEQWMERESRSEPDPESEGYRTVYSGNREVERTKFLVKLDSVLNYFTFRASSEKRNPIGFHGPRR